MERLTRFSKIILFLTSYVPLGVIFLIIEFDSFSFPFFKNPVYALILIVLVIILPLLLLLLIRHFYNKPDQWEIRRVESAENMDSGTLSYIFTYILPFLNFPEERRAGILIFLLFIIGIIYVRSDMLGINPLLTLFGYHIIKIRWEKPEESTPQEATVITKIDHHEIRKVAEWNVLVLHNELYLLKGVKT